MNALRWRAAAALTAVFLLSAAPVYAQAPSPSGALFGSRLRNALDATTSAQNAVLTAPALGASETDTAPTPTGTQGEPYNAGFDLTSGVTAAGGAMLGVIIIILLFGVIGSSRHHEMKE